MAIRIWVTVEPRAKTEEVRKTDEGQYLASVHAPPQKGKANEALIELLALVGFSNLNREAIPRWQERFARPLG